MLGTVRAVDGNKETLSCYAQTFLEMVTDLLGAGSGTYESSGKSRWLRSASAQLLSQRERGR